MSNTITIDQFKRVLPKNVKTRVTTDMVVHLNGVMQDQALRENFRDNLLSYTGVMSDGRYKINDYINAVKYVSYKLLGSTNIESYTKTFPERFQRLTDEGADGKTISSYSTAYFKTQLVQKILEQTLTPVHILNNDIFQKAINKQAYMMNDENVSAAIQQKAADSLLSHLKPPETLKMELEVGIKQDKSIDELRAATEALTRVQKQKVISGQSTVLDVAHSVIIPKEAPEIEDGDYDEI